MYLPGEVAWLYYIRYCEPFWLYCCSNMTICYYIPYCTSRFRHCLLMNRRGIVQNYIKFWIYCQWSLVKDLFVMRSGSWFWDFCDFVEIDTLTLNVSGAKYVLISAQKYPNFLVNCKLVWGRILFVWDLYAWFAISLCT